MTSLLKMEVLFSYANYLDHQYSFNTPYFTYKYITYAWSKSHFQTYPATSTLLDPMCGKATILLEAAKNFKVLPKFMFKQYSFRLILQILHTHILYIFYRECFVLDVILTRTNWSRHKRISSLRMSKSVLSWFVGTVQVSLIGTQLLGPHRYFIYWY